MHELKAASDDAAVAKHSTDFPGLGRRGDVEILRANGEEKVSNASPHQVGLVIKAPEAANDLDDV